MHDPLTVSLLCVVVGFASGVLSALAGIGGAVISTPGIRALGAPPIISVGSTVPAIIPGALTGTIRYARAGLVNWRVGLWCGLVGTASALAGAFTSDHVDASWLMVVTAALVLWSSVTVLRSAAHVPPPSATGADAGAATAPIGHRARTGVGWLILVGLAAGFTAGLLGVGGGIILVPAFTLLLGLPVKEAVPTSLVAVALMSVSSLCGHWIEGHIDWTFALPLAVGVVPGARLGSRLMVVASERTMRLVAGTLTLIIGMIYLAGELRGILG